jgi:hypothetical protein
MMVSSVAFLSTYLLTTYKEVITVMLTLNPATPKNGFIFSLPQAVPAGQIKSFAIPQQKETIN